MAKTSATSRETYARLLAYMRPRWKVFALAVLSTMVVAATEPLFPALMKPLLDNGFGGQGLAAPWVVPAAIIGIFAVRGVFNYAASYGFSWVSNHLIADLRARMFERLVNLPQTYFQLHPSSEPITRITSDVNGVASAATTVITTVVRDSLVIVGLIAWLLYLNWKLTLITFVMIPAIGLLIRVFSARLRRMSRASQEMMAVLLQVLQENIFSNRVVKVFGGERQEIERFDGTNRALRGYAMRQGIAAGAVVPLTQFFGSFALALVVYIALVQAAAEHTTVGGFVSFITAMLMLLSPMKHLADVSAPLQRGLAAAESVFRLLDESPETDLGTREIGRAHGRVEFRGVTLRYPQAERDAVHDVSFVIEPGRTLALVGPSGSGKTTLAQLLPRFYQPGAGQILLDSIDLQDLRLASLRANIALVSQDIQLFDDTIAANIAYGAKRGAIRQEIEEAARAAYALDFIRALPQGFDTQIGEHGTRLSGGQRQRIAIARAILKDAPLLILDEATSALDSESERQIQAALDELMKHRTTLVIAHRLSTIERADRILVLQQGRVVESGRHEELIRRDGVYAQLHRLQYGAAA